MSRKLTLLGVGVLVLALSGCIRDTTGPQPRSPDDDPPAPGQPAMTPPAPSFALA